MKHTIMTTPELKANIGLTLVILFLITLITGVILHLKAHGIIIQPRAVIKIIHWIAGVLMAGFALWHGVQFRKMFHAIRAKAVWFWGDTWAVMIFLAITLVTGLVKLLSPVKIPHLGMWHYWLGLIMSVAIIIHLFRGIPSWNRLRKL